MRRHVAPSRRHTTMLFSVAQPHTFVLFSNVAADTKVMHLALLSVLCPRPPAGCAALVHRCCCCMPRVLSIARLVCPAVSAPSCSTFIEDTRITILPCAHGSVRNNLGLFCLQGFSSIPPFGSKQVFIHKHGLILQGQRLQMKLYLSLIHI